jgi:hypothetical protein
MSNRINLRHRSHMAKPHQDLADRRKDAARSKGPKRAPSGLNDCWRPSLGASKEDLAEYHAEEMGLRRARQRSRSSSGTWASDSIATENRHGGPHRHAREIERRNRQASRT